MAERKDRRVHRTRALLRQGLTSLLQEKSLKDITVKELTQLVDINRGTFYCHYRDIYDMVEQLENEMFEEFSTLVNAYSTEDLRRDLRPILVDVFHFVDRNADMCAMLLGGARDMNFFLRLKSVIYEKVLQEWGDLHRMRESPQRDYYMAYLVNGVLGLLQTWLEGGLAESSQEMAMLAEQLILSGINPLRT